MDRPDALDPDVLIIRPHRIRTVCWVLAPAIVAAFVLLATALAGPPAESGRTFQAGDSVAMIALGLAGAAAILLFTRPKVVANTTHIVIQNVIGGYDLPWGVVRAVRFDRGSPWLTLELHDDDVVAVMAVQAVDKERAVAAARALRRLHVASMGPAGDR